MSLVFQVSKGNIKVMKYQNSYTLYYPCDQSSDCAPYTTTLPIGLYQLEVWGAEGGHPAYTNGGAGGYSFGVLNVTTPVGVFIHIGQAGRQYSSGYNGGSSCNDANGYGGGGATDIRMHDNTYYHRVIVAGGGGGVSYWIPEGWLGKHQGWGGGEVGGAGQQFYLYNNYYGYGGTQTNGGTGSYSSGVYGLGGVGSYCGGGGGWYGGGGSNGAKGSCGGGSGFVLTSWSIVPSGYALGSIYNLSDAFTVSGDNIFYSPNQKTMETGHTGHGVCRITILNPSISLPTFANPVLGLLNFPLSIQLFLSIIMISSIINQ